MIYLENMAQYVRSECKYYIFTTCGMAAMFIVQNLFNLKFVTRNATIILNNDLGVPTVCTIGAG